MKQRIPFLTIFCATQALFVLIYVCKQACFVAHSFSLQRAAKELEFLRAERNEKHSQLLALQQHERIRHLARQELNLDIMLVKQIKRVHYDRH